MREPRADAAIVAIERPEPRYPARARRRHIEGYVRVELQLGTEGRVRRITVLESKPPGLFDRAVREAVSHWRFRVPEALKGAVPTLRETIRFRIGE